MSGMKWEEEYEVKDELPEAAPPWGHKRRPPDPRIQKLADACRYYEGKWVKAPWAMPTAGKRSTLVDSIRKRRRREMQDGRWDAAQREKEVWVRYTAE